MFVRAKLRPGVRRYCALAKPVAHVLSCSRSGGVAMSDDIRRREFLQMSAGAAAIVAAPTILTAKKTGSPIILGSGEHRYEVIHDWPQLPDQFHWQVTHNVAVDRAGNLYVIHQ